ncbi:MAG TPA: GNAT family N-acetyltransferase [Acidimicrobiia bacterium]|nr:GNAT family N-acetyltransferase [Acidimicrobiia bacterium]
MRDAREDQGVATTIRPASVDDAAAIAALHGRSFLATYPELLRTREATLRGSDARVALWTSRLQDLRAGRGVFVAQDSQGLCGFVYTGPTTDNDDSATRTGQVYSIHVDPDSQGAGIGSELLNAALALQLAAGMQDVTLWVVDTNLRAREFYEARGFRLDGARRKEVLALGTPEGDQVDVVRYRCRLGAGGNL